MASLDEEEKSAISEVDDIENDSTNGPRSHASRRYREMAASGSSLAGIFWFNFVACQGFATNDLNLTIHLLL